MLKYRKSFIVFLLASLLTMSANAQSVVEAKVVDSSSQKALQGVHISLNNASVLTTTNTEGYFRLEGVKATDLVIFQCVGYQRFSCPASACKEKIMLQPKVFELQETVVTGSKVEYLKKEVPLSVTVISEQMIEHSTEASAVLPIVSERTPGLFVTERGITGFGVSTGAAGRISIRGLSGSPDPYGSPNSQVLVLIDGHPQFMGIFGHPISDAYVASDVEKVEVIRGPASVLYGSGAMAGVINIISKKAKKEGVQLNMRATYGSFNTHKLMGSLQIKKKKFSMTTAINSDHTDGHRGDSSGFNIINTFSKLTYDFNEKFSLNLDANLAQINADDPGPASAPSYFGIDILRGKVALSLDNKHKRTEGALKCFYNFGEHDLSDGWHSNDENMGLLFYQGLKLFKNNVLTLGYDLKNYGGKGNSGMAANEWKEVTENGFYVMMQQKFKEKYVVDAGFRMEHNSVFGQAYIPHLGFSWQINALSEFKTSLSKGFRSPLIMELYLFAPNPDLQPEEVWNYEISYSRMFLQDKINMEATLFYMQIDNLIARTLPPPFPPSRVNSGEQTHYGLEFSSDYRIGNHFKIHLNYSYLHLSQPLLAAPEHQLFLGSSYQKGKISFDCNLQYIGGLYTSVFAEPDFWGSGRPEEITDYLLLNARLSYKAVKGVEVFISGENLLNQEYCINYDYPMPGISVLGGARLNLNLKKKNK
jgi:outer membrane cobalamin receptor